MNLSRNSFETRTHLLDGELLLVDGFEVVTKIDLRRLLLLQLIELAVRFGNLLQSRLDEFAA